MALKPSESAEGRPVVESVRRDHRRADREEQGLFLRTLRGLPQRQVQPVPHGRADDLPALGCVPVHGAGSPDGPPLRGECHPAGAPRSARGQAGEPLSRAEPARAGRRGRPHCRELRCVAAADRRHPQVRHPERLLPVAERPLLRALQLPAAGHLPGRDLRAAGRRRSGRPRIAVQPQPEPGNELDANPGVSRSQRAALRLQPDLRHVLARDARRPQRNGIRFQGYPGRPRRGWRTAPDRRQQLRGDGNGVVAASGTSCPRPSSSSTC